MRAQIHGLIGDAPIGPAGGVSRFDLTTEREYDEREESRRVLKAFRALIRVQLRQ